MGNRWTTWRPKGWENHYSEEYYRKYLPFAKRWQSPLDIEWSLEDCEIAYEAGADAILDMLRAAHNGYFQLNIRNKEETCDDIIYAPCSLTKPKGKLVFIPDEDTVVE